MKIEFMSLLMFEKSKNKKYKPDRSTIAPASSLRVYFDYVFHA